MKKITLLLAAFFVAVAVQAQEDQVVLSQTSGVVGQDGVACGNADLRTTGDNVYLREYDLNDHGLNGDVTVTGAEFHVATFERGPIVVQVRVYEYVGFPFGFDILNPPPALVSQGFEVNESMVGQLAEVLFDDPVTVSADATLIVGVFEGYHEAAYFYLGTASEETKPSYLASEACEIYEPVEVEAIGFPNSKHIINLVVDTELSTNDVLAGNVAVYPNPTSDVFNIDLPKGVEVTSSSLVDVMGRTTGVQYINGQMNVSALAKGVYFLNIDTNQGSFTQKVVKQ